MPAHGLPYPKGWKQTPWLTLEGPFEPTNPCQKSATNSHPHHSSPGPTTLKAMHYLTAVQLLMPERRRLPACCHCASQLCSSNDSTWAEEACFLGSQCRNSACMLMSLCTAPMCPGPLRMLALVALLILAQITQHSAPPRLVKRPSPAFYTCWFELTTKTCKQVSKFNFTPPFMAWWSHSSSFKPDISYMQINATATLLTGNTSPLHCYPTVILLLNLQLYHYLKFSNYSGRQRAQLKTNVHPLLRRYPSVRQFCWKERSCGVIFVWPRDSLINLSRFWGTGPFKKAPKNKTTRFLW